MRTRRNLIKFGILSAVAATSSLAFLRLYQKKYKVREILHYPAPLLRNKSDPVEIIDKNTIVLSQEMLATLKYRNLIDFFTKATLHKGISAPQVGVSKRLCICIIEGRFHVLINPEIIDKQGNFHSMENCMSLPEHGSLYITRSNYIKVKYKSLENNEMILELRNKNTALVEHEIDHLNGILYIDHHSFSC
ncbi:MAG: peptide deformylase [Proteobacteria bacterium]|nr:peptide deformylase [Pseudomonadota bacterium]MBU1710509.1 peptide deformylase [Pseudomonadota bacterium]